MKIGDLVGGRFELERLAATGGMGLVYRARDLTMGSAAALKFVRTDDEQAVARFRREAEILQRLSHPNIVEYFAHGTTDEGELYLAMEWLEGQDLAKRLETAPLSLADTLTIATHVAAALGAAHGLGIVHGDLKPSNIFLVDRRPDRVKFLDFGVARRVGTGAGGMLIGTPLYMPPEQALGKEVDARADVYALGAVLFRCLTGDPPFTGESVDQVIAALLTEPVPHVLGVPAALDDLLARMLSRDREGRPANGAAVHAEMLNL